MGQSAGVQRRQTCFTDVAGTLCCYWLHRQHSACPTANSQYSAESGRICNRLVHAVLLRRIEAGLTLNAQHDTQRCVDANEQELLVAQALLHQGCMRALHEWRLRDIFQQV